MRNSHKLRGRPARRERLEARITPDQKRLIERAALLRGTSVSEFVIASAQQAATATIEECEAVKLRDEARDAFVNAILQPPSPNKAARAAAARYKKIMGL